MRCEVVDKSELSIVPVDWRGLHRQYLNAGEMDVIAALVRKVNAHTMVEIGCRDGRTARVLLDNVSSIERYVGIDVPMDYRPGLAEQCSEMVERPGLFALDDPRFDLWIRPHGSLDLSVDDLPACDAIFIDGDHSRRVVAHDSAIAWGVIRNGGVIIWHDYLNDHINDVREVLDHLNAAGWPIKHVAGTWLAICQV
jgi:predicted O-methyltransferase YrrM